MKPGPHGVLQYPSCSGVTPVVGPSSSMRVVWLALVGFTMLWALNWTVSKVAVEYASPLAFTTQRYVVATVALCALLWLRRGRLRPTPWILTILIGLSQAVGGLLSQWALVSGGAGRTAMLVFTIPFWVVPLAWWWAHEKPGSMFWLCLVIAAAGFLCVAEPWHPLGSALSITLAVASGLMFAVTTVLSKCLFQRHPDVEPLRLTAWQMVVGATILVTASLFIRQPSVAWNAEYVGVLLYNGLIAYGLCWVLWTLVVRRLPATVVGLAGLAEPVGGVLFAWLLLGERPSGLEDLGIVLIGVALLSLNLTREVRRA